MADTLLSCNNCQAQYPKRAGRGNQRQHCDDCRPLMMRGWKGPDGKWVQPIRVYGAPFQCVGCLGTFPREGVGQRRCRECRRTHQAEQTRQWRKASGYRRPDAQVRVGDYFDCQNCSASTVRQTGIQKHCQDCQRVYRRIQYQRPEVKLKQSFNGHVRKALRGRHPRGWCNRFSFTVDELKVHLQRQFVKGMSWENYGYGAGKWHVDHIRPVASFDFLTDTEQAIRECWALSNLRPLWGLDNQRKSNQRTHLL